MVRNGFYVLSYAGLLFGLACMGGPARGEDKESKLRTQLAVQAALQQGRDNLQRGNYQAAVYCLEKEITRVDGSREYMNALREAYRGYIRDLHQANRHDEARTYQERLKILDPGYQLEMNAARPKAPNLATLAAQTGQSSPPPPKSTAAASYTARPQMPDEQTDQFSESVSAPPSSAGNAQQPSQARDLLARAKQAFDKKDYAGANRLFEQANQVDNRAVAPCHELWAFCKLYGVTEAVNKAGWAPPADAEKEVLAALALTVSPQLERQGKAMLATIKDRRVEVRHTPAQGKFWATAETANFCVIHMQSRELAEQVARVAETTRSAMIRKWFAEEPASWDQKCKIVLYATGQDYARATHEPASYPGHSKLLTEPGNPERVVLRKIELHCDVTEMLTHVLPHETTHTVLAGRFGRHDPPRWADEGVAILSEPREKIDRYLKGLPAHRSRHELLPLAKLMGLNGYPEKRQVTPFYVQSVALVEFLSAQTGGPPEFVRFVRDGLEGGYEAALQKHYGIKDFNDLQQRWERAVSGETSDVAAVYRQQP
jgi:hypothetical protein